MLAYTFIKMQPSEMCQLFLSNTIFFIDVLQCPGLGVDEHHYQNQMPAFYRHSPNSTAQSTILNYNKSENVLFRGLLFTVVDIYALFLMVIADSHFKKILYSNLAESGDNHCEGQ